MSTIKEKIQADLKDAMRSGNNEVRDVLRMVDSMIKNAEIEKGKREEGLTEDEMLDVLSRAVKQRYDSIEQYKKGGRVDLAEKEQTEVEILKKYLPEELSEEELRAIVKDVLAEIKAENKSDFGKAMGVIMPKIKGRADGNLVRKVLEEFLK